MNTEDPPAHAETPDTTLIPGSAPYANRLCRFKPAAIPTSSAFQPPIRWWRDAFKKRSMVCPKNPRVTDPTYGMSAAPATAVASAEHEGHTYYFCGKGCAKSFSADPGKYTNVALSWRSPRRGEGVHPRRAPEPRPIAAQTAGDWPPAHAVARRIR